MISQSHRKVIIDLTSRLDPTMVGIFGSWARGEQREDSDLDILIDFDKHVDLLELVGIEQELASSLGVKVDLITRRSVLKSLLPHIESELIRIL